MVSIEQPSYVSKKGDSFECGLCPNHCRLSEGKSGLCRGRSVKGGRLLIENYGKVTSIAMDPIEKKPLYHYHPGSYILSVGSYGCNMDCRHCQNHSISQDPIGNRYRYVSPEDLVSICHEEGSEALAFTYNEPTVWYDYVRDVMECGPDIRYVLVTNGYIERGPLDVLCGSTDAMNIDVKGFTEDFYRDVCGARLHNVLETCSTVFRRGIHLELTYLIIPGYNDTEDQFSRFSGWVCDKLSCEVPVHFTRFHPDNRMTYVGPTPIGTMEGARDIAKGAGLINVYLGNVPGTSVTSCPGCGKELIRRSYDGIESSLKGNVCDCGRRLYLRA